MLNLKIILLTLNLVGPSSYRLPVTQTINPTCLVNFVFFDQRRIRDKNGVLEDNLTILNTYFCPKNKALLSSTLGPASQIEM